MKFDLDQSTMQLTKGKLISLPRTEGSTVAVLWGSVWLTQDGDSRDYELNAGELFTIRSDGMVLISAFENSAVTILQPCENTSHTTAHSNTDDRYSVRYISGDELQHYTHVAHALRAQYVAGLMESLGNALRRGLATLGHYASELWLKNLTGMRSDLRNHLYLS